MLHVTGTKKVYIGDRVAKINGVATATAETIESATEADPAVVTITGHSFSTGDYVTISEAVDGEVALPDWNTEDGDWYHVTKLTADTFSLQEKDGTTDVDSTGFSDGGAIDGGTVTLLEENLWDVTGDDTVTRRVDLTDDWNDTTNGLAAITAAGVIADDLLYTPVTYAGDTIGTAPEWGILSKAFADAFTVQY